MTTAAVAMPAGRVRAPVGLTALRLIVGITYVIYIAVSFFKNENFLFGLDALLGVAVFFAVTSRAFAERTVAHGYLLLLLGVYAASVMFAWVALSTPAELAALKTLRNLLYCAGVFIVVLTYVTSRERLSSLVQLMAVLTVLSALYGIRQAVFGYWQFELDRLALMGSSLAELLTLGRARLTATFGDPLLCGFYMMTGLFVLRARWYTGPLTQRQRLFFKAGSIATFVVLVASLTRAPLLGFAVGSLAIMLTDFHLTRRSINRILGGVFVGLAFIGVIVWIYESEVLANSVNPVLHFLDTSISSVWSLVALFIGGGNEDNYFLVSQSKDMRQIAWTQGLAFLASNPLGAGFTNLGIFTFALGDTGLLQIALLIGIPGALAYVAIAAAVFFRAFRHLRRLREVAARRIISALLGLWVAMMVTTAISSLATTSVAAVMMWLVAGALVNAPQIFPLRRDVPVPTPNPAA